MNGARTAYAVGHEPGVFMLIPLLVLSIGSIFGGYILRDLLIGVGTPA